MLIPLPIERYMPAEYRVRIAAEPWEIAGCHALRRAVFCHEQAIFDGDDRDARDATAIPLAAISSLGVVMDQVVGTVRIHQDAPGEWSGSRLAVREGFRRVGGLGTQLIRLAVSLAHARGARRFTAHVQTQNVELFRSLHWHSITEETLHGHPHHLMWADLSRYPAEGAREILVLRDLPRAA
jgi:putative N-acetyltransferase (TIGR04045 family)